MNPADADAGRSGVSSNVAVADRRSGRWCARAARPARSRAPRAGGVFQPTFGSLVQPGEPVDGFADRATAAAVAACVHSPAQLHDEVIDVVLCARGVSTTGTCARIRSTTVQTISETAILVAQALREGDWLDAVSAAVVAESPHTVRALIRAATAAGVGKRQLNAVKSYLKFEPATALGRAVTTGNPATVATLLEAGADPDAKAKGAATPLVESIDKRDNVEVVRLLVAHGARTAGALHVAAKYRAFRSMEVLLAAGASADELGGERRVTPLKAVVCEEADTPAPQATLKCVELLLDAGASLKLDSGASPLAAAAGLRQHQVVQLMLQKRGTSLARGRDAGMTLLRALSKQHADVVRVLLDGGVPIGDIKAALRSAAEQQSGTLAEVVLAHVAESDARRELFGTAVRGAAGKTLALAIDDHGWAAATVRRVFAPHRGWFPLDGHGEDGYTALQRAVGRGQIPMVRALVDCGADPSANAGDGRTTALSIAQRKVAAAAEGSVEQRMAEGVLRLLQPPS